MKTVIDFTKKHILTLAEVRNVILTSIIIANPYQIRPRNTTLKGNCLIHIHNLKISFGRNT